MPDHYLSTAQVAELIGVGRMTVWRMCRDGLLPYTDVSRSGDKPRYRILASDLHGYLETKRPTETFPSARTA